MKPLTSQLLQFTCRECLFGCMPVDITTVNAEGVRERTRWGIYDVNDIPTLIGVVWTTRRDTVRVIVDVALNPGKPP